MADADAAADLVVAEAVIVQPAPHLTLAVWPGAVDVEWLMEAVRLTRKDGAPGIDGVTARQYEERLEENLQSLLDRAKSGEYRAPAVRRVFIPKGDGSKRPIGIPTFEDKVLQRAVHMVLEPLYEQEFHDCSYGFRPGRSAHQALHSFRSQMTEMRGGWVLEVDIRGFFDAIDHGWLVKFIEHRIADRRLVRLIQKWLSAGVLEDGKRIRVEVGTPQLVTGPLPCTTKVPTFAPLRKTSYCAPVGRTVSRKRCS